MSLFPFREECQIDKLYQTDDIYDFIGRGTFASVFKAISLVDRENINKGDAVALKVFHKRDLNSEEMRFDVINEVEVLRRVSHKNCLRLLDCFQTPLHVVIVMNCVDGVDLFKAISDSVFTDLQVRSVAQQLLEALDYLHNDVGVVHRDVKPENILITPVENGKFHVTLVDFGLARAFTRKGGERRRLGGGRFSRSAAMQQLPSGDSFDSHSDSPLIATPCGTLNYAAPETVKSLTQVGGQLATTPDLFARMDMYSVGTILHVMLSGKLPFRNLGNKLQLVKEMEAGPLFTETRWQSVPPEAIELTKSLLHFDPAKRPRAREALQFAWFRPADEGTGAGDRGGVLGGGWMVPGPVAGGRCITVQLGAPSRATAPSYIGFCP